ncbi:dodecin family protein [Microvirga terricola]|uniref:Dodecin domain-containing protein n=1 Tax=Microvirga terricola TaxID=2719797 RepID=A0ABX0V5E3_9HYPH|nr:dodecin family protein [Microvirga terricola]NIX75054.1 dodecin domain-containing protein [Microvirga terricola]
MTLIKVIEVLAESDQSWEEAARRAVKIASQSVRNIRSIYIENFEAAVSEDSIRVYRINAKISFALEPADE